MGETGIFPVEGELVVTFLTMPRPPVREMGNLKLSMHETNGVQQKAEKSHVDQIRDTYETEDLSAIMARFFSAVSWRKN